MELGKIRPERVKRLAQDLVNRFPNRFTEDFNDNKKAVEALTNVSSHKLRNRIAGYVTRLIRVTHSSEKVATNSQGF